MKHVRCEILDGIVVIYREERYMGEVCIGGVIERDGEPVLRVHGKVDGGVNELSFNDLEIIMDNWNQMKEMQRKEKDAPGQETNSLDKFRFNDEKRP